MSRLLLILMIFFFPPCTAWGGASGHAFTTFDLADIEWVRDRIQANDPHHMPAYAALLRKADEALSRQTTSVLDKQSLPPSGNKRDFYAIGAYSWPDPEKGPSAPYIRRDGHKNPEAYGDKYDKGRFNRMVEDVNVLSLAYFYSKDERYARKAVDLLRSWFIDARTSMNPHLRHAAVHPGVNDGYFGGIIEGVVLIEMLDYVELLRGSGSMTEADFIGLRKWFGNFAEWLVTSDFGKQEVKSRNNHGSWFAAQATAFFLYSGSRDKATSLLGLATKHLDGQFARDGSLPREMKRSNSFMYAVYGLRPFVALARLSEHLDRPLWNYGDGHTPTLEKAFYFLSPYFSGAKQWEGPMIDTDYDHYAIQIFYLAGKKYRTRPFSDVVRHLVSIRSPNDRFSRLLIGPPLEPISAIHDFSSSSASALSLSRRDGSGWIDPWRIEGGTLALLRSQLGLSPEVRQENAASPKALQLEATGEIAMSRSFRLPHRPYDEDTFISIRFSISPDAPPSDIDFPFLSVELRDDDGNRVSVPVVFGKRGRFGIRLGTVDQLSTSLIGSSHCALISYQGWTAGGFRTTTVAIKGYGDVRHTSDPADGIEGNASLPTRVYLRSRPKAERHIAIEKIAIFARYQDAAQSCIN